MKTHVKHSKDKRKVQTKLSKYLKYQKTLYSEMRSVLALKTNAEDLASQILFISVQVIVL